MIFVDEKDNLTGEFRYLVDFDSINTNSSNFKTNNNSNNNEIENKKLILFTIYQFNKLEFHFRVEWNLQNLNIEKK